MIRPSFFQKRMLQTPLGRASRYPYARRMIVVSKRQYTMQQGETLYSVAAKLFGLNRQYYWTIIADINIPRYPDEWEAGDIIWLPETIVQDTPLSLPNIV